MSPPLPGSEVMVPHCSPATALANTACRCSSQAGWVGSGVNSQNATTAGCMAETSATAGSAEPSILSSSQIVRADDAAPRQSPPDSSGHHGPEEAGVAQGIEVALLEVSATLTLGSLRSPPVGDLLDVVAHRDLDRSHRANLLIARGGRDPPHRSAMLER